MTRSAAEIEREVEDTRAGLDETVEALKSKMSPGQIVDELTQSLKGAGAGDLFANLGSQVKENPLALAMIGAGVAWLMMGKSSGAPHQGAPPPSSGHGDLGSAFGGVMPDQGAVSANGSGMSDLKDKVSGVGHEAAARVAGAASSVKDGVTASADHAMHAAQSAGKSAADMGHMVQRTFMDTLGREPLIIGALGIAVGAAIGASFPATEIEDRTFGSARDRVADKAKAMASDGVEQAKDAVEAAFVGARDAAQESGLIGAEDGTLAEKAESVIRSGVEAAKDTLADRGH